MKLKVLMDNNTYIDEYVLGEPALAFYIEVNNLKILFDTGYSDALIKNAQKYNINLASLDYIVLSHAHNDHTRGLYFLLNSFDLKNTTLITNNNIFTKRRENNLDIGMINTQEEIENKMKVIYINKSFEISEGLWIITNINSYNNFENKNLIGEKCLNNKWIDDDMAEESALVYQKNNKLNIISACSHRGICNLIEQAKLDTNISQVNSIIGGLHLFEVNDVLKQTRECFIKNNIKYLYPSHCVSFKAKAFLNESFDINEVGIGLEIDYDKLK